MTAEDFEKHVLFDRLKSLKEILSNKEVKRKIDIEKLSYFQTVYSFIDQRIKITVPNLVQLTEMDSLSSDLNEGVNQLNHFIGNDNEGHLNNSINNFNAAISKIKSFPVPIAKDDFNFSRKIANFENTVINKYKTLEEENNKLKDKLGNLNVELLSNHQELEKLLELINGKDAEIHNLNSSFQTEFDNIKSQHQLQFSNALGVYRTEIDKSKEQFRQEINELKIEVDESTSTLVANLTTKHDEAKKLVNLIGNVGITGNYQNIANNHKKDADLWRWVAIGFMAAFSVILIWTIWDLNTETLEWQKALVRIIAAVSLSYPATYAARESSRHRKLETINRNAELELASINPFIEDLEVETKQKIKGDLVEKYFGNHNNIQHSDENDPKDLYLEKLERIVESISKIKK